MRTYYPRTALEIDLRAELEKTFEGDTGEIPKKKKLIIRRMRRDSDDKPINCSCRSSLTQEPDMENECPFCLGEGYYWDEDWIYGYSATNDTKSHLSQKRINIPSGLISAYDKVFIFRYTEIITLDDKIIELKLDSEGVPTVPYKRKAIYRPETILELRSDYGRLEFLSVYVNENNAVRLK